MRKKLLSLALALVMCLGLLPGTASAVQDNVLTISFETAVYSISKETYVRTLPAPASQGECGPDEYVTICAIVKNTSGAAVTIRDLYIRIDGGEELRWARDITLEPGRSVRLHVYHANERYLTPGLHTAALYSAGDLLSSGYFGIGRDWSKIFRSPSEEQIAARPADKRSPYLSTWLSIGGDVRYDAYSVDLKSDHIPYGTYSSVFNGYMDYSSLKERYASVDNGGYISLYGGLQQGAEGKPSNSILSFWDIYCTDAAGNTTIIRPKQTYSADGTSSAPFTGEGDGAHTLPPYDWQAGRWYRMVLRCGTSKTTGNTTVEQWFQDLTTKTWTHMCTYDIGVKDSCFVGNVALFSENYLKQYAGGVRSLEFTNVRIHTDEGWQDVTDTNYIYSRVDKDGVLGDIYGSWDAGADENTFYMISTGVPGWGRTEGTGKLTIQNRESGAPLAPTEPVAPTQPQQPSSGTAYASTQKVTVDGKAVEFQMYALKDASGNGTNYIKLRDLAYVLDGTEAQFSVGYDGRISLTAGQPYTAAGGEMTTPFSGDRTYTGGAQTVKVDGKDVTMTAITLLDDNGGGYNYFKLRDLGRALGFHVGWSAERGVSIETDRPYSE